MLTLHHLQRSQSERIIWLCEELEIPYELKLYKRDPTRSPPDLKALTPLGSAPVITDGALKLAESAGIIEYILHKYGGGRLALPPSHPNYANYLYWFHFSNGNLQPMVARKLSFLMAKLPPDSRVARDVDERMDKILKMMDSQVSSAPWLAGDEFTAADVMSVFSLSTMRLFTPLDLTAYPGVLEYLKRVGGRKAYQTAMAKGDSGFEPALGGPPPESFLKSLV